MSNSSTLLCLPASSVAGDLIEAALIQGEAKLCNCIFRAGFDGAPDNVPCSVIVFLGTTGTPVNGSSIAAACKGLVSGGRAVLMQPSTENGSKRLFIMCGLTSVTEETQDVNGVVHTVVKGTKPTVELGSTTPLDVKSNVWKIDIAARANDDFIDEEDLLTEEDRAPVVPKAGCATSKSACENCSCGRAEAEAKGVKLQLTQEMIENPQSNCGNCGRGDGFRCATCPYRGLPAFEPGRKIELPPDFLMADA